MYSLGMIAHHPFSKSQYLLLLTTIYYASDVYVLLVYTHVRIKIYREFHSGIIYISNEGRHVRIKK